MPKNTNDQEKSRWLAKYSMAMFLFIFVLISYFFLSRSQMSGTNANDKLKTAAIKARVILTGESDVKGNLTIHQDWFAGPVHIVGTITGLKRNSLKGFHVHALGDLSDGCMSTGSHYNPLGMTHGAPEDKERHFGDLGNVKSDKDGVAEVDIKDQLLSLVGPHSILGRSIVVHTGTDDLGKGGFEDSKTTGHAGGRAACGVIGLAE